ncbi:MAG: polysaccharide deacetylase family protein [Clostridia bacterium]|nr:polysaccharide deacetylase family protein [Clostridia bacterium]
MNKKGCLVLSLDFELFWGVTDSRTIEKYGPDIITGRESIPRLLKLFDKYGLHTTWGTVGMLFAGNKDELAKYIPEIKPNYDNTKLSAYKHFETIGLSEEDDKLHYAQSVIREIISHDHQEIGSHTFSHYYCREKGQTYEAFDADTMAARKIAKDIFGIDIKSFIFPRNYFNAEYLKSLKENNILAVRGNQKHFAYDKNSIISRMFRLIDTYIPVCGSKSYYREECHQDGILNLKASVFFRKYYKKLWFLEPLKMLNIKLLMTIAAKKGKVIHIWWHPHNMGSDPEIFFEQIETLFKHYKKLNAKYGFESKNMGELAEEIINEKDCNVM